MSCARFVFRGARSASGSPVPVAESEQRLAEATAPRAPAVSAEEEFVEETPRVKPEIPGMDLEVDIVREGEEALRAEDGEDDGESDGEAEEDYTQPIAGASIDLAPVRATPRPASARPPSRA